MLWIVQNNLYNGAGAYYGMEGIPEKWLNKLTMKEEIEEMASNLFNLRK